MLFKLLPAGKDYLWGGDTLKREYGKTSDGPVLAETWELSCHPDGPSPIADGPYAGMTLAGYLADHPEALGSACLLYTSGSFFAGSSACAGAPRCISAS